MKLLSFSLFLILLSGCASPPKPPKGGTASQEATRQQMTQPDAPEGISRLVWHERKTEHTPEGVLVVYERMQETELGGAQDWAAIVREYARADFIKGLLWAAVMAFAAIMAWHAGWPVISVIFGVGSFAAVAFVWWAALVSVAGGFVVKYAYQSGGIDRVIKRK